MKQGTDHLIISPIPGSRSLSTSHLFLFPLPLLGPPLSFISLSIFLCLFLWLLLLLFDLPLPLFTSPAV